MMIVTALVLLGADALTSLERGGEITVRSLDLIWSLINPAVVGRFQGLGAEPCAFLAQSDLFRAGDARLGRLIGVVGVI